MSLYYFRRRAQVSGFLVIAGQNYTALMISRHQPILTCLSFYAHAVLQLVCQETRNVEKVDAQLTLRQ